jgi:hypothetical protein
MTGYASTVFRQCAELLRTREFPWRTELQASIRELDSGVVPCGLQGHTYSRLLWFAIELERCDLVENILQQHPKVDSNCLTALKDKIDVLKSVAPLIISHTNVSKVSRKLSILLDKQLLHYSIPFLGNTPKNAIVESCDAENVHHVVASGLCTYEEVGTSFRNIFECRYMSGYLTHRTVELARTMPALPQFVELAQSILGYQFCWYWVLYASQEERGQVLANTHHLRHHVQCAMSDTLRPIIGVWTLDMLHELPVLPTDIACWILVRSCLNGLDRVAQKLSWRDGSVYRMLTEHQLLSSRAIQTLFL